MISCVRDPEKFPATAWVIAVGGWRVRLYKCMTRAKESGSQAKQRECGTLGAVAHRECHHLEQPESCRVGGGRRGKETRRGW